MRAGRRNTPIIIKKNIENNNGYGETITTYTSYSNPWAFVSEKKGREFFAGQQINNKNPIEAVINYDRNISDKYIVLYDDREFEIKSVMSDRLLNETKLYCSETT